VSARPDCSAECREALQQLERFLDGELPDERIHEVKEHLTACYPCTDRATFEEQLRAIVRRECVEHAPPRLVESIRARLSAGAVLDD
jgi:mycothiol system anti-sigma-R factor